MNIADAENLCTIHHEPLDDGQCEYCDDFHREHMDSIHREMAGELNDVLFDIASGWGKQAGER